MAAVTRPATAKSATNSIAKRSCCMVSSSSRSIVVTEWTGWSGSTSRACARAGRANASGSIVVRTTTFITR